MASWLPFELLPPARWPFCFVAYGLFWAVCGPFFFPVLGRLACSLASGSKTLASQAERAAFCAILMDNSNRLHCT